MADNGDRYDICDTMTAVTTVTPHATDISPPGVQPGGAPGSAPGVDGGAGGVVLPAVEEGEHTASFSLRTSDGVTGPGQLLHIW